MNILDTEPMKYARVGEEIEKVFDGKTNDIKEEKSWNEYISVLLDIKRYSTKITLSHTPTENKILEQKKLTTINNLE